MDFEDAEILDLPPEWVQRRNRMTHIILATTQAFVVLAGCVVFAAFLARAVY